MKKFLFITLLSVCFLCGKAQISALQLPTAKPDLRSADPTGDISVQQPDTNQVFIAVQVQPQFPGGLKKFNEYVTKEQQLPKGSEDLSGRVIAQFIVERDGTLSDIKVLRSPSDIFTAEATRLLNKSPKWMPGVQNGKNVRCYFTVVMILTNE